MSTLVFAWRPVGSRAGRPRHRLQRALAVLASAILAVVLPGPLAAQADAIRDQQWALHYLRVAEAHRYSTGRQVIVAVIDTGVDADHPDLSGNVLAGRDAEHHYTGGGNVDADGHGTAMAGLIAGHGHGPDHSQGILGIAQGATILPIHVFVDSFPLRPFRTDRPKDDRDYVEALNWAVDYGARVISMSTQAPLSGGVYDALTAAHRADVVLVAAAGNRSYSPGITLPATHPDVIAVGGIDPTGQHWTGAVTAPEVRLAAPAVDNVSTSLRGGYQKGDGTSDAAAIVSGTVALIRAQHPKLTAEQVTARLLGTATDAGPAGRDQQYGYGIVNPLRALTDPGVNTIAGGPASTTPTPTITTAAVAGAVHGGSSWWGLLFLPGVLVVAVAYFAVRRHRDRNNPPDDNPPSDPPGGPQPNQPAGWPVKQKPNRRYQPRHHHLDAHPHRPPSTPRASEMPTTYLPHRDTL